MGYFSKISKIYQVLVVIFYTFFAIMAEHLNFGFWMVPHRLIWGIVRNDTDFFGVSTDKAGGLAGK
jgi:hypothetical protein